MFRRIVFTAALAGLIAGLVLFAMQSLRVIPIIHEAETYEAKTRTTPPLPTHHPPESSDHVHPSSENYDLRRGALTALANVITAIGFALLLTGAISLRGSTDFRRGLLWGLGGFAAFSAAPALGLPPELPGTIAAGLFDRQAWWLGTAAATAIGLALIAFAPGASWKIPGALLIALPHLIGAPQPESHTALAPEALQRQFVVAALATSGIFWLLLGGLCGYLFQRFERA